MVDMRYIMTEEKQAQHAEAVKKIEKGMKLCVAKREIAVWEDSIVSTKRSLAGLKEEIKYMKANNLTINTTQVKSIKKNMKLSLKHEKSLRNLCAKEIRNLEKQGVKEVEAFCRPF